MRRLLLLALIPALSACGGVGHPAGGSGALEGTVFGAPATPTCAKGQSCSRPAPGVTLRFSKSGSVVARVKTGNDGSYEISLAAGGYFVASGQPVRPEQVTVADGSVRHVDFTFDTKIR
jgi:hypothetical protein